MAEADSETTLEVVADSIVVAGVVVGSAVVSGSGVVLDSVTGSGVEEVVGAADEAVVDEDDPDTGVVESPQLVPAVVKVPP